MAVYPILGEPFAGVGENDIVISQVISLHQPSLDKSMPFQRIVKLSKVIKKRLSHLDSSHEIFKVKSDLDEFVVKNLGTQYVDSKAVRT